MNNNKRVLQISLDVLIGNECDGTKLAEQVDNELNCRGYRVVGSSFIDDMTECYEDDYPELIKEMKFDWRAFTESDFNKYIKDPDNYDDYIGAVYVGDICIDLLIQDDDTLIYDFYVAHEDTGYGCKNNVLPYDYADGDAMDMPYDLSYKEFKAKAEQLFEEYIIKYNQQHKLGAQVIEYSLIEHANRPLEIW